MTPYRWLLLVALALGALIGACLPLSTRVSAWTPLRVFTVGRDVCLYVTEQGGIWGYTRVTPQMIPAPPAQPCPMP